MTIRIFIQKIDGRLCYGIMMHYGGRVMEMYPGSLEQTIKAYEGLTGQKMTEEELELGTA